MGRVRTADEELFHHAVSADELARWMRDIDGGDMTLLIDACQSAASVGEQFKPGPMGARGLGQLAYEKGMRVLAASQAEEEAHESSATQQGLMSFALANDGLDRGYADFDPKDGEIKTAEWLAYAVGRVPELMAFIQAGKLGEREGASARRFVHGSLLKSNGLLQTPALFDFTKGTHDYVLDGPMEK